MTGKVFGGRYEIKDRIGIGGMAEVYRAQDSTLGRVVAVKVMLPQFAADPSFTAALPPGSRRGREPAEPLHRERVRLGPGRRAPTTSSWNSCAGPT